MVGQCIDARNNYTKLEIQQAFASGLREMMDDTDQPADQVVADSEESLSVFCVSARAYRKLNGRLKKDTRLGGFTSVDQTEIPQLQNHCTVLTEKARKAASHRFLVAMNQMVHSIDIWSSAMSGANLLPEAKRRDSNRFNTAVHYLTMARGFSLYGYLNPRTSLMAPFFLPGGEAKRVHGAA